MTIEETFQVGNLTVNIIQDSEFAESPFKTHGPEDRGSLLLTWHRNYNLGDDPQKHGLPSVYNLMETYESWDGVEAALVEKYEPRAILPVYLLDHSGLSVSTGRYACGWDSGQVGFIMTYDEGNEHTDPEGALRAQIEELDDYLQGNVYGFTVNVDGDEIESRWGFIGRPAKSGILEEARASAEWLLKSRAKEDERCAAAMHL